MIPEERARIIFQLAIEQHRAAELLTALFDGGSVTIDATTGRLIIITAEQLTALQDAP